MIISLSNLGDNLAKGIHKINCKSGHVDKKCETCGIKYSCCECCLQYTSVKDDLIKHKSLYCIRITKQCWKKTLKKWLLINTDFLTNISISLFYCCKKEYTHMNIWMIGKMSMTLLPE